MRTAVTVALLVLVVSAGCTGPGSESRTTTTLVDAATETTDPDAQTTNPDARTTDPDARTTSTEPAETSTTTDEPVTTSDEPQKGDQFLSVSELNESQAMQWNASKRATFGNLSAERQRVVTEAVECDCNVELDGEFSFHDKDRIEVVYYDGTYYFLRVSIV